MATIGKITTASSGSAAIDYAYGRNKMPAATKDWLKQQGVDPATVEQLQNRAVVMSGLNVDPEYAKTQMKATRMAYNTRGKQTTRVIQSFPTIDLHPANPHDWQTANQLGLELAKQAFPDYQVAIYTQLDGSGHKLHNHIIVNMPNLKTGEKYHEHQSWQRLSKINDEISREHGLSIINHNTRAPERRTMAERQLQVNHAYVWKDDLRGRIDKAMLDGSISSYKGFSVRLAHSGIIIHDRGKSFSYEFLDADKKHRRARGKTLGADYEKETILNELERQNRQPSTQPTRLNELNRKIEQRKRGSATTKQSIEQRERQSQSRKRNTSKSSQGINRLTIAIRRTDTHAHQLAIPYNREITRKRRFRDRATSLRNSFAGFVQQINHFIKQISQYNLAAQRFHQRFKADQQAEEQHVLEQKRLAYEYQSREEHECER